MSKSRTTSARTDGARVQAATLNEAPDERKVRSPDAVPPVVALGASAGGLSALTVFFQAMPADCGLAFVVIHHADPDHESLMAEVLGKHTCMSVELARDKAPVQPDHVYIIPPSYFLRLEHGALRLSEHQARRGMRLPIDYFLRSLATDQRERSVAIILSGTGSDGTQGIRTIGEQGGLVIAQDPDEAAHAGMSRSAIRTGMVDYRLPVAQMPAVVAEYGRHPYIDRNKPFSVFRGQTQGSLSPIVRELKAHSPINFECYKVGTLLRRIERRMSLKHVENAADYLVLLQQNPDEASLLCNDLLISVTSFFRDPEAFACLADSVLPDMIKACDSDQSIRIWVPACATGEEAYSISMLLIEQISLQRLDIKLQVFASDVDEHALSIARAGIYPESIEADVSAARLIRFFVRNDHSYQVTTELRESVNFARQNLLAEPPFSRLDMISCRNLLIYLNADAQERILSLFHFALNKGGRLFLGPAESVGAQDRQFRAVSSKYRVYERIGLSHRREFDFPITPRPLPHQATSSPGDVKRDQSLHLADLSRTLLIDKYAPAAALINPRMQVLYTEGPMDAYLQVPGGEPSQDILQMARDGLRVHLGIAIRKALQDGEMASSIGSIVQNSHRVEIRMTVHPMLAAREKYYLVTFSDQPADAPVSALNAPAATNDTHQLLEQELEYARRDLQVTVRELELSNEKLKAANEEAMSVNEEFQSTNEELQSLHEELTTLNAQLQQKIGDSTRLADDLNNLLKSSAIATLFLDRGMNIRRYTPAARTLFNVIATDIGRPFADITRRVDDTTLLEDAGKVLHSLTPIVSETRADSGQWFNRSVLPYQTQAGFIDGVVVTYADITPLKALQTQAQSARVFAESLFESIREPVLVLGEDMTVVQANRAFHRLFGTSGSALQQRSFFDLANGQWDSPELRRLLAGIIRDDTSVESFELTLRVAEHRQRTLVLSARAVVNEQGAPGRILLSFDEIIEQEAHRERLMRAQKMETIGQLTGGIAHDFNNLLTIIMASLEFLENEHEPAGLQESLADARSAAEIGAKLTRQLLSFGQRLPLEPHALSLNSLVTSLQSLLARSLGEHIELRTRLESNLNSVMVDPGQLENAILNLALNARDAMPEGGRLTITTENVIVGEHDTPTHAELTPGRYVMLSVTDTGIGMTEEIMERAFEPYFTTKPPGEGTGLGLPMIYGFARQSGGHVALCSEPGQGAAVSLILPQSGRIDAPATPPQVSGKPPMAEGETVLVVEDDPAVRKLTLKRLRVLGYKTLAASNGPEAIGIIRATPTLQMLLTDAIMPGGLSGFEVVEQAWQINPALRAMVVTGYSGQAGATFDRRQAHPCRVLRKPYRMNELAVALREVLHD